MASRTLPARAATVARLLLEKLPLAALSLVSSVIAVSGQAPGSALMPADLLSLPDRVANALVSYGRYLAHMLWPNGLSPFYPHPALCGGPGWAAWQVAVALLVLAALSSVAVRRARSQPYWVVGWLWFLVALVPVIGLVQVGSQAMADRYFYLPGIGLFIALAWGGRALASQLRVAPPLAVAVLLLAASLLAATTAFQVAHWRTSESLFRHALAVFEANEVAHDHLGVQLEQRDRLDEAAEHFERALEICPVRASAVNNLGTVHVRQGRVEQGRQLYERAIRLKPSMANAHMNLARLLEHQGDRSAGEPEPSHRSLQEGTRVGSQK